MGKGRSQEVGHGARDESHNGISRRALIRRAAATGAVAWTAPTIIGSLASPAGAVTGFPCSYMSIVVQKADMSIVAVKVVIGATTCANDNSTSGDSTFTNVMCGGAIYSNNCMGTNICRNGTSVPANTGACPVTVNGAQVTATAGNTILFAITHDGQCTGPPADKFCPPCCGPTTSCTGNCPAAA
jgi:hypothetical protein